jgi:prolyl-tRNA editing enzyme YbaK/EbsC (Cys-tRNA(Pro) deacylase)
MEQKMKELLTVQDLRRFVAEQEIDATFVDEIGDTPTVPAAASALGVAPEQIIKTLLFLIHPANDEAPIPVIVISNGLSRVDKRVLAARYNVGRKRVKLAAPEEVAMRLGYPAGGVPPFGHRTSMPVLLDQAVLAAAAAHEGILYGGGGDDKTMLRVTLDGLMRITTPTVVALSE